MNESHEERTASEPQDRVAELIEQQTAISEVLRAIASSPHDLQPIFDAILDSSTRLCRADICALRLSEESGLRLVAMRGDPLVVSQMWSSIPVLAEKGTLLGRLATSRLPTHIPDLAALEGDYRDNHWIAAVNAGFRAVLVVPLLKDNEIIGTITLGRTQLQPFTDKQVSLFRDFAAQATIALESTRREREFRQVQNELAHANRVATMGQLTASIAHELKQPLAAAATNGSAGLRWLMRHPPEIEKVKQSVERMVADVNRACVIIDRIHSLVKMHAPQMEKLDINGAILEVAGLIQGEVLKNGVTARMELAESLPHIQGDRVQLQQVILNLMINSIQAISDLAEGERELHVATELIAAEGVRVAVRDSGPGFSAENLQHLFAPFYTTKPNGMGMGLSICRSIIEDHGGRLWASRIDPQGALFQFTIPVTQPVKS
jgi:signal transduction histidine kinase